MMGVTELVIPPKPDGYATRRELFEAVDAALDAPLSEHGVEGLFLSVRDRYARPGSLRRYVGRGGHGGHRRRCRGPWTSRAQPRVVIQAQASYVAGSRRSGPRSPLCPLCARLELTSSRSISVVSLRR